MGRYGNLAEAIERGVPVVIVFYSLSEKTERRIDLVLSSILQNYGKLHLQSALYTCIKEMAVNAAKTNAKMVFFTENDLNFDNEHDYASGIREFKSKISENWIQEYGQKAKVLNLNARIYFYHNEDGLRIETINSMKVSDRDEARVREKFKKAMSYDDLLSFYMDHADESEGAGLGFAMNFILLRAEGIDPALFRMGSVDGKTRARIEIPYTENFVSVRGLDYNKNIPDHPKRQRRNGYRKQ